MEDKVGVASEHVGTGSSLILVDEEPLIISEVRPSAVIETRAISTVGIDISADQPCTVKVVRLPDGITPGAESILGSVAAGAPAFFTYSSLLCPAIKIIVENTGGAPMTSFAMFARGGA